MEEHCFTKRAPLLSKKIEKRADVVSDLNLQGFLAWGTRVDKDALDKVMDVVSIREHKCIVDVVAPSPAPMVQGRLIKTKQCNRTTCPRCDTLRGGYYFQHTSTRWTPRLALVASKGFPGCPNLARFLCKNLRWPLGLLPSNAETELRREAQATVSMATSSQSDDQRVDKASDRESLILVFLLEKWNAKAAAQGVVPSSGRKQGSTKADRLAERMRTYQSEASALLALVLGVQEDNDPDKEESEGSLSGHCNVLLQTTVQIRHAGKKTYAATCACTAKASFPGRLRRAGKHRQAKWEQKKRTPPCLSSSLSAASSFVITHWVKAEASE